jgi:hypothetical protein
MPANDPTLNPVWEAEQVDRLLGFEVLRRAVDARYQPVNPVELADRVAVDKGYPHRIIEKLRLSHAR